MRFSSKVFFKSKHLENTGIYNCCFYLLMIRASQISKLTPKYQPKRNHPETDLIKPHPDPVAMTNKQKIQ